MPVRGFDLHAQRLGITEEEIAEATGQARQYNEEDLDKITVADYPTDTAIVLAQQSLDFLAGLAMPDTFEFSFPPVLLAAWQMLLMFVSQLTKEPKLALGIPRGHGKTTVIKLFILYCILFTKCRFILVISATATLAENIIADVFDMLNQSNIIGLFGDWKINIEKDTQNIKKFGFRGRAITVAGLGAGGSVRGLNLKNERPDIMVFDDVQTKECSESELESGKLERWMLGTAMKAKSPKGCFFIFAGNMYPGDNSLLKKIKKNPNWIKFISGAILADGKALWPKLRSLDSLISELNNDMASGHPEIFFSEVLNDTEAGINNRVDLSAIRPWPWKPGELPQGKCILIDPATDKAKSDDVAIGYCEVFDGRIGLRFVIEERLSPSNTILKALSLALKTNTKCIIVESQAYQYSLLHWFEEKSKEFGINGIHFVPIYSGGVSKNSRIAIALKGLTQGDFFIHQDVKEKVIHQVANWNPMKRDNIDNILDLLSYMPRVLEEHAMIMYSDTNIQLLEAESYDVQEDNHAF